MTKEGAEIVRGALEVIYNNEQIEKEKTCEIRSRSRKSENQAVDCQQVIFKGYVY